ncbi:unnamed protein product [Clonostachys chloroleuca]|uniref:Cellulose-binding protein n=1 Tax=Clonostachys chloroleuca TaxID=1926264 RepID=A0AA35M7F2_9HYPO|nr:unnamed protein product [Clonostachys chloroleuca]
MLYQRLLLGFATLVPVFGNSAEDQQCLSSRYEHKTRLFVLTDMSNEPDDQMSFVRLLTYANEIDIRGIAATTSTWLRNKTDPETIREVIGGYGEVLANLNANVPNDASYPSKDELLSKVSVGHSVYGLASLKLPLSGAAEALVKATDDAKADDPLWVSVWGGAAVLAEALNHVSKTREKEGIELFVSKLRVYSISDQDDAGAWIRTNYPDLFMVVSLHGFNEYTRATWNGISGEEYRHFDKGGPETSLVSNAWLEKNIRIGALGAHYLNWTFIMEGDTPAFLTLIQNGLGDVEHPDWGSWGGRYTLADASGSHQVYADCTDYVQGANGEAFISSFATIWRWRQDYQYDFAARMQWTINSDYSKNNHQPVTVVNGTCGPSALELDFVKGTEVVLDASNSWDPDGDGLSFEWFHYREAGTRGLEGFNIPLISQDVKITKLNDQGSIVSLDVVKSTKPLHIILAIRDDHDMALVTYRRIILSAKDPQNFSIRALGEEFQEMEYYRG